jgi:hypothetical protein
MARRKKSKPTEPTRNIITELDGWSTGDNCYTVFSGESKPSLCEIIEFHPTDTVTPSVSVTEVVTRKYRVAPMMAIAESAKEAKALSPGWQDWLKKHKAKKQKQERARRNAAANAARKQAEEEAAALAAAELEAEEAATRELKKKKRKK